MRQFPKTTAAIAMAAALLIGAGVTYAAQSEAWVKVEFKFRVDGKIATMVYDIPVSYAKDVPQYCERDLFWSEQGLAFLVQQAVPELADATFVGLKCVTEGGKIKWASQPTNTLPRQRPKTSN